MLDKTGLEDLSVQLLGALVSVENRSPVQENSK